MRSRVLREFTEAVQRCEEAVEKHAEPRPVRKATVPLVDMGESEARQLAPFSLFQKGRAGDGPHHP